MKQSLEILENNIIDIQSLIALLDNSLLLEQQRAISRSSIVLLVASWEQYIEQLASSSIKILTDRLRNSSTLPEGVKQGIAFHSVSEKRTNQREFSDSVWAFADKGWKEPYNVFCNNLTSKLNNAVSYKINELYNKLLGIRKITNTWSWNDLSTEKCRGKLDDLINLRHCIAHGDNTRDSELEIQNITEHIEFISKIANQTYQAIYKKTTELSQTQAITYSLRQSCFLDIIELAYENCEDFITLDDIKSLGSSAQGNHNKLCYEPWALLIEFDTQTRAVTKRLRDFFEGNIKLPLEILVFDNNDSIPKPKTKLVSFSEIYNN